MLRSSTVAFAVACCIALAAPARTFAAPAAPVPAPTRPPAPAVVPVRETHFGTTTVDPYRYFENLDDPRTRSFMREQNAYTRATLARLEPERGKILARIASLDNAGPSVGDVQRVGDDYFYERRAPGENTTKLYVRAVSGGPERLLVDPDVLYRSVGKHGTIDYFVPSLDGKHVAYGASEGGSEDSTIRVVETATGRDLGEAITRGKNGVVAWDPDGRALYYIRYPKSGETNPADKEARLVVYRHPLGADPDRDPAIFGYAVDPAIPIADADSPSLTIAAGSPYVVGVVQHGVLNEETLYAAPLAHLRDARIPWTKIADVPDDVTGFDVRGETIYLLSHHDAARFKILATSLAHPDLAHARTVVPEGPSVLAQIGVARDALYVRELDGPLGRVSRAPFLAEGGTGALARTSLPYEGAVVGLATDPREIGATFGLTGWTHSELFFASDARGRTTDVRLKAISPIDASAYTSVEVKAPSADGTLVPLSIVYKRGIALDGSHPTYLEGYGAYGITLDPYFSPSRIAWLERGGVYAIAHVRGGGEYGEAWHRAGEKLTKQHTIDDFVACARYLVARKYTAPAHLAGEGTSAGGITIGGAIVQHPELFAAALDVVGVTNALRGEFSANGPPNVPEFGSVSTRDGFAGLLAMDAYAHVRDGVPYPAVMAITGINDPRVPSWEPAKFAARLQAATSSGRPVLLRVDYDGGHGFLASSRRQAESLLADQYAFLLWQLGDPAFADVPITGGR